MRANAVRSLSFFGITFGALPPFAHFGVPLMSIITRCPYRADVKTRSSRSLRRDAGSPTSAASAGPPGAARRTAAVRRVRGRRGRDLRPVRRRVDDRAARRGCELEVLQALGRVPE